MNAIEEKRMAEGNERTEGAEVVSSPPPLRLDKKVSSGRDKNRGTAIVAEKAKKSLLYALLMSVVPGLGHFYLGSARMGLIFSAWISLSVLVLAFFLLWGLGEFGGGIALGVLTGGIGHVVHYTCRHDNAL